MNAIKDYKDPKSWAESDILKEVRFKAALSGGKGGQNVNKVSTKIELYWTPSESYIVEEEARHKIISRLSSKLNKDGVLRIVSEEERSQLKNKQRAIDKFCAMLAGCFKERKKRKATKPTKASVKKRLEQKTKQKKLKADRKKPDF